jgi:hypothetical protein
MSPRALVVATNGIIVGGGRSLRAFVRQPNKFRGGFPIRSLFGDLTAKAGVREQTLGDFRRIRHAIPHKDHLG